MTKLSMTAAASMKDIPVGMAAAIPPPTIPMTRSPTARPVTSFPTAVTSPSDLKAEDVTVPVSLSAIDAFTLKKVSAIDPGLSVFSWV
ncbi:hypothetical protein NIBR502774_15705 (plasmid) [Rhizobium sp. NIBRBAC000502774]|nr:hypothetical protein NIBR502774_15705 [Rhizobium sp. NIBRBAC000502774]